MLRKPFTDEGEFLVGVHKPTYRINNLRENDYLMSLGMLANQNHLDNKDNFPAGDVYEGSAKLIYEIPNVFPFRGTTYIDSEWAAACAKAPDSIRLPPRPDCSLKKVLGSHLQTKQVKELYRELPKPVLYALAANSTDPDELALMAETCCRFVFNESGTVSGLHYSGDAQSGFQVETDDFELFETIANNAYLPDRYKEVMVLRPGAQGSSEIVGEWKKDDCHVFEYLRRNSYIPWGHFAANMAHDSIRYQVAELSIDDLQGLRHLYYQRVFVAFAGKLGLQVTATRRRLKLSEIEELRSRILNCQKDSSEHAATLWGWNFGYDMSASGYRLHASHQMIHNQYAVIPEQVKRLALDEETPGSIPAYCCGDLVADALFYYQSEFDADFFSDYLKALENNRRIDGKAGPASLIVWQDDNVKLFVPKAQTSQWEMQLLVTAAVDSGPVGNVIEADYNIRSSIDTGIFIAQKIYAGLGARMVTSIEFSKRFGIDNGQRLLYSFLPKLPWSMGAFSEAQLRFICSHFPEDFAFACREQLDSIELGC